MITIYGIKNCATVQKALSWLNGHDVAYSFHDYKKEGIDAAHLKAWSKEFGWEKVLNRSGMMWRKTADDIKAKVVDEASAIEFMINVPTAIKRPIIESGNGNSGLILGFDEEKYKNLV